MEGQAWLDCAYVARIGDSESSAGRRLWFEYNSSGGDLLLLHVLLDCPNRVLMLPCMKLGSFTSSVAGSPLDLMKHTSFFFPVFLNQIILFNTHTHPPKSTHCTTRDVFSKKQDHEDDVPRSSRRAAKSNLQARARLSLARQHSLDRMASKIRRYAKNKPHTASRVASNPPRSVTNILWSQRICGPHSFSRRDQ